MADEAIYDGQKKRILVTGGAGLLGTEVVSQLMLSRTFDVFSVGRSRSIFKNHISADLTKVSSVRTLLDSIKPDAVVHCAAVVDLEKCENDRQYARALHVEATRILAEYPSVGHFVYISTDSVFDGKKGRYDEGAEVNPLNYYAQSKLEGEFECRRANKSTVLRTNLLGFSFPLGTSFFEWIYRSLEKGTQITGFSDVTFNPLYTRSIARVVADVVNLGGLNSDLFHLGSRGSLTKEGFIRLVAQRFKFDERLISSGTLSSRNNKIVRPLNTTLVTDKIAAAGFEMPSIQETVQELFRSFEKP